MTAWRATTITAIYGIGTKGSIGYCELSTFASIEQAAKNPNWPTVHNRATQPARLS